MSITITRDTLIVDLPLSGRSRAVLAANGFRTVADLCTASVRDLRLMKGVGPRTVERLMAGLAAAGIFLWSEQHEQQQESGEDAANPSTRRASGRRH